MNKDTAEISSAIIAMIAEIRPKAPALGWPTEKMKDATLDKDMGLDSLDIINLYFKVETAFSFKMSAEDIAKFGLSTVGALATFIATKT